MNNVVPEGIRKPHLRKDKKGWIALTPDKRFGYVGKTPLVAWKSYIDSQVGWKQVADKLGVTRR